ncbi:MAG: hypothetical protein Q7R70_06845 [Candidatus Diapherotrites archaeon]|nr:hypothetical protein [Candidatus Diapherotrites archaeon]
MAIETFEKTSPLDGSLNDFLITRIEFNKKTKEILSFCVLQMHYSGEKTHEIIRFDTSHGFCHVHRFFEALNSKGIKLAGIACDQVGFNYCKNDVKSNWRNYKRRYIEKWID